VDYLQPCSGKLDRGRNTGAEQIRTPYDGPSCDGIDQNVKLNRALWVLAEEIRNLK
jgi:hypothetical protein